LSLGGAGAEAQPSVALQGLCKSDELALKTPHSIV
jgi:hypothetical protein